MVHLIDLNLGVYHLDDQDKYSAVGKLMLLLDFITGYMLAIFNFT